MMELIIAAFIVILLYVLFRLNIETVKYTFRLINKPKTINITLKIENNQPQIVEVSDKNIDITFLYDKEKNSLNFNFDDQKIVIELYEFKNYEKRHEGKIEDKDLEFIQTKISETTTYLDIQILRTIASKE